MEYKGKKIHFQKIGRQSNLRKVFYDGKVIGLGIMERWKGIFFPINEEQPHKITNRIMFQHDTLKEAVISCLELENGEFEI